MFRRAVPMLVCTLLAPATARAQAAAPPAQMPLPLWDMQVGASFVGTSGNSETATFGADFSLHHRWPTGTLESTATAVWSTAGDVKTAERYLGLVRAQRKLTTLLSLSTGERAERDLFSGTDLRSILDGGLGWALVRGPQWQLDGVTSLAWNHLKPIAGRPADGPHDSAGGVLQLASRVVLGASSTTTERLTFYPAFGRGPGYRAEAEATVQAAINGSLALKFGYLLRYSSHPVPGFLRTDQTTTASILVQWKADRPAPGQ